MSDNLPDCVPLEVYKPDVINDDNDPEGYGAFNDPDGREEPEPDA